MNAMPWRTGVGRSGSIPVDAVCAGGRVGEEIARIILVSICPCRRREAEASVAGAFVVLPHRQCRTPQRFGLLGFERLAVELLGQVGCDHLEDPSDPGCATPSRRGARPAPPGGSRRLPAARRDRELAGAWEPVERRHDRAALGRLTRPAAIAAASTSYRSRLSARRRSARASRRTCRVSTATQSAAVPAPESIVASERSASASSRSSSASSCAFAWARVIRAARCCPESSTSAAPRPPSRGAQPAGGRSRAPGGGARSAGCS